MGRTRTVPPVTYGEDGQPLAWAQRPGPGPEVAQPWPPPGPQSWPPPYWPYPPPAPPAARRPFGLRLALILTGVLVLCGTPAVWAVVTIAPVLGPGVLGLAGGDSPAPSGVRSPRPGDPEHVRAAWIRAQIDTALGEQASALLAGDETRFMAVADGGNATVRNDLALRFRGLRALNVTQWKPGVAGLPTPVAGASGRTEWQADLSLRHCFVEPACEPEPLEVATRWVERDGKAYLVDVDASDLEQNGPRPWELSELKVSVGRRAVVVTTEKYAVQLPALLADAEQAAVLADRFVVGGKRPDRYHVFLAGPAEWRQWYSRDLPAWAAGYAVSTSARRMDVVLNAAEVASGEMPHIMRHELSHAASLRGARHQTPGNWWLIEGLAEHAEFHGQSATRHDAVSAGAVRRFVRSGGWDGAVTVAGPNESAPGWEAGARYGIAFLTVRRLVERYGEAKLLAFYQAVVHDGKPFAEAASAAFGADWAAVQADCVSYLKRTVGA